MEDANLIAHIYYIRNVLEEGKDITANVSENRGYGPSWVSPRKEDPSLRFARGGTQPPEDTKTTGKITHLRLGFDEIPHTSLGYIFGSSPRCDFTTPNFPGISAHHFSLTFDDYGRLIVKDLSSMLGTEVTYDDQGSGRRSNFQWIISGYPMLQNRAIIIRASGVFAIRIVPAHHNLVNSPGYADKVRRFRAGSDDACDLFYDLNLPSGPATQRPTGTHTPGTGPIWIKQELGSGSFGTVQHIWNVSNGVQYALKQPTTVSPKVRHIVEQAWRKEALIMKGISHPHIIKLLGEVYTPNLGLYLEYAPCGSLSNNAGISKHEAESILDQCLSALEYLHGRTPKIMHRDIKPDNILVMSRNRAINDIQVKLGDFGLAKRAVTHRKTRCGTDLYIAPEILEANDVSSELYEIGYTELVDIWSLGVTIYELFCPLPSMKEESSSLVAADGWCDDVVREFNGNYRESPSKLKLFILNEMLALDPRERASASRCRELKPQHSRRNLAAQKPEPQNGISGPQPLRPNFPDTGGIVRPAIVTKANPAVSPTQRDGQKVEADGRFNPVLSPTRMLLPNTLGGNTYPDRLGQPDHHPPAYIKPEVYQNQNVIPRSEYDGTTPRLDTNPAKAKNKAQGSSYYNKRSEALAKQAVYEILDKGR